MRDAAPASENRIVLPSLPVATSHCPSGEASVPVVPSGVIGLAFQNDTDGNDRICIVPQRQFANHNWNFK